VTRLIALSWSGGKDSALALYELQRSGTPPALLLTTFDEETGTVPHHGVAVELLAAQADAAGLPLATVALPTAASNAAYEQRLRDAFGAPPLDAVAAVAFGDLFLADLRRYREARMAEAGRDALFPLWGRETRALARAFIEARFRATVVSVDGEQLDHTFVGRTFDDKLLRDLPATADPCGERGEFHTFVHDGPIFERPVAFRAADGRTDGRFAWLALTTEPAISVVPANEASWPAPSRPTP
jgi:uncharacterized protein (TIGR00290 family)